MMDEGKLSLAELGRLCREFLDRANGAVIHAAKLAAEVNERILLGEAGPSYTFRDWYDAYCSSFSACPPINTFLSMGGWTTLKKREVATKLLKTDPSRSDRAIAKDMGIDHKTVADVRCGLEANGEIPHSEAPKGRTGPKRKPALAKTDGMPQPTALALEGNNPLIAAFNAIPEEKRHAINVHNGRLNGASKVPNMFGKPKDDPVTKLKTTWLDSPKRDRSAFTDAYNMARAKELISRLPRGLQIDLWNWLSDKLKASDQRRSDDIQQVAELVGGKVAALASAPRWRERV
jgi:hypothetical protein